MSQNKFMHSNVKRIYVIVVAGLFLGNLNYIIKEINMDSKNIYSWQISYLHTLKKLLDNTASIISLQLLTNYYKILHNSRHKHMN